MTAIKLKEIIPVTKAAGCPGDCNGCEHFGGFLNPGKSLSVNCNNPENLRKPDTTSSS